MGAVTTYDPVSAHERTRAALAAAIPRLARLLREVPDLDAASGVPRWSVGDVGAHLASVYLAYGSVVSANIDADGATVADSGGAADTGGAADADSGGAAEGATDTAVDAATVDWASVLPAADLPFVERIAAMNDTSVALLDGAGRARLGDLLAERGEAFLRITEGLAPDAPVTAPWYGPEPTLTVAVVTGLMLSESLVHGLDIARGAGLPWPIGADEASLVIGQSMPTMMGLALDAAKARGVRIAFDLVVRGGPRLAVVVDDGTMTVTRDAPPRAYDCRLTVDPAAFLLVSFRRTPIWKAVALGRMRAGGRRPWLATRLGDLVATP